MPNPLTGYRNIEAPPDAAPARDLTADEQHDIAVLRQAVSELETVTKRIRALPALRTIDNREMGTPTHAVTDGGWLIEAMRESLRAIEGRPTRDAQWGDAA